MKQLLSCLIVLVMTLGAGSVMAGNDKGKSGNSKGVAGHRDDDSAWRHGNGYGHCKNKGKGHHKNKHDGWEHDCDDDEPPAPTCTVDVDRTVYTHDYPVVLTVFNSDITVFVEGVDQIEYSGEICSASTDEPAYVDDENFSFFVEDAYVDSESGTGFDATLNVGCSLSLLSVGEREDDLLNNTYSYSLTAIKTCQEAGEQEE